MKNTILCGKNIYKTFTQSDEKTQILLGIDVDIYEGDFTVVMGSSGAGKSTLLYALSGMDTITGGSVTFKGQEISKLSEKKMAQLRANEFGFVFQQTHLVSNLTLFENIVAAGFAAKAGSTKEVREKTDMLLLKMHAETAKDRLPSQVSGGEAQRAAIARAMIGNPSLLFADEPTCTADNEIVITEFIAANFGITIGDTVTVRGDSGSGEYIVSGIYSCANDMGDNFGMNREGYLKIGRDHPNLWCWHYFLADNSRKGAVTEALESAYGGDIHVHENTWPGLFGIILAMQALLVLMYALVIVFILIVTVMTGSKILLAEQKDLGIYKAIGFSSASLQLTFALRFAMAAVLGGFLGTLLAAVITDPLVSSVMKLAGISNFVSHPNFTGLVLPMVVVTLLFAAFGGLLAGKIKKVPLTVLERV